MKCIIWIFHLTAFHKLNVIMTYIHKNTAPHQKKKHINIFSMIKILSIFLYKYVWFRFVFSFVFVMFCYFFQDFVLKFLFSLLITLIK